MTEYRAFSVTVAFCVLATLLDVAVLNIFFFSELASWSKISFYHTVLRASVIALPFLLIVHFRSAIPLIGLIYFLFGLEDTVFYLLHFRLPPEVYQGVWIAGLWEPLRSQVIILNATGLLCAALLLHFRTRFAFKNGESNVCEHKELTHVLETRSQLILHYCKSCGRILRADGEPGHPCQREFPEPSSFMGDREWVEARCPLHGLLAGGERTVGEANKEAPRRS